MIDYSVIIRTTGKAGQKYQQLLNSIAQLVPQPREVIVVLPENYQLPPEKLGWEKFYFCKKGMVTQRLFGIDKCNTKYALICDDDVCFENNFVEKLHQPIEEGVAQISAGPLLAYLPKKGIQSLCYTVTGAAVPRHSSKGKYITVLPTTGYSYFRRVNTNEHTYLEAESLPWTCFYGDINAIRQIRLDEERWLQLHGYASMDDQTMFYKAYLMGIKTVIVSDAVYEHLDAKTSRQILEEIAYAMEFNRYVFWHRFIYSQDSGLKRIFDLLSIEYYFGMKNFYNFFRLAKGNLDTKAFKAKKTAIKDAKKFVKSDYYLALKPFTKNNRT